VYRDAQGVFRFESTKKANPKANLQVARDLRAGKRALAVGGIRTPGPRQRKKTLADLAAPPGAGRPEGGPYWRDHLADDAQGFAPSTKRDYRKMLCVHWLPKLGSRPLVTITPQVAKSMLTTMIGEPRHSYSRRNPNPKRPTYARKTLIKLGSFLSTLMEAAVDYEFIPRNDLRGIKWAKVVRQARVPDRNRHLEIDQLRGALEAAAVKPKLLAMDLVTVFGGGPNWAEGARIDMRDVDVRRHRFVIRGTKADARVRTVEMSPLVEAIFRAIGRRDGDAFPVKGGTWVRRQWEAAQRRAGIDRPINWHGLRHMFVSLAYQAEKPERWVAQQVGHKHSAVTHGVYEHFFQVNLPQTYVTYLEELLWPKGWRSSEPIRTAIEALAAENGVAIESLAAPDKKMIKNSPAAE
jgi:integrase